LLLAFAADKALPKLGVTDMDAMAPPFCAFANSR